jgi:hypothetical protein
VDAVLPQAPESARGGFKAETNALASLAGEAKTATHRTAEMQTALVFDLDGTSMDSV